MPRRVLHIEIDITEVEVSWVVAIQRSQMETRSGIERQLIVKRSSKDSIMCIPEPGLDNFVTSVTEVIYE